MLQALPAKQGWKVEVISESPSTVGGYKAISAELRTRPVRQAQFESACSRPARDPHRRLRAHPHPAATVAVCRGGRSIITSRRRLKAIPHSAARTANVNKTESAIRSHTSERNRGRRQEDRRSTQRAKAWPLAAEYDSERKLEQHARGAARGLSPRTARNAAATTILRRRVRPPHQSHALQRRGDRGEALARSSMRWCRAPGSLLAARLSLVAQRVIAPAMRPRARPRAEAFRARPR